MRLGPRKSEKIVQKWVTLPFHKGHVLTMYLLTSKENQLQLTSSFYFNNPKKYGSTIILGKDPFLLEKSSFPLDPLM